MKTSTSRLTFTFIFTATMILLACPQANAQSNVMQRWFGGGVYQSQAELDALYSSNAQNPLGGFFAPGFTRTLTVLGGLNYPSASITEDLFELGPDVSPILSDSVADIEVADTGYALSFAFGRRHSRTLRSEIEVAFRSNIINNVSEFAIDPIGNPGSVLTFEDRDGNVDVTSLMKNVIFDFHNNSRYTPYAGIGIGLSYVDVEFGESTTIDEEPTFQDGEGAFTYQAIGGVATKLNSAADFIVEYRFLGTSEVEFDAFDGPFVYNTSSLFFGLKYEY